jgi:hypothetical protein
MYHECILVYLKCIFKCSVTFQENTCILTFRMYCTRIPNEFKIHLGYMYISDTSRYMYLARFLCVTLDTYQETSGYLYLGLFIKIHQDTQRYKITIHVSWTRHNDTSGYNQDTS